MGILTLPQVISNDDITGLRQKFWHEIDKRFDIREQDVQSWFANPLNPAGDARAKRLSGMNPVMDALRTGGSLQTAETAIQRELDGLFGPGRWEPLDRWYSLLSFPGDQSDWMIPHNSWHNDEPIVVGDHEPWSIFAFVFLDRVDRETGPTLAITGSHRRGEIIAQHKGVRNEREVRAFEHANSGLFPNPGDLQLLPVGQLLPELAATDPWFRDLVDEDSTSGRTERFMRSGTTHHDTDNGDIASQVVALAADAGDVILFDPRCLHSVSSNISNNPRQVLRIDFRRTTP